MNGGAIGLNVNKVQTTRRLHIPDRDYKLVYFEFSGERREVLHLNAIEAMARAARLRARGYKADSQPMFGG